MATNSNRTPLSHTRYVCQHNIAKYPDRCFHSGPPLSHIPSLCSQSQQHRPVTRLRVSRPDAQLLRRGRRRGQSLFPRVNLSSALGRESWAEPGRKRYTGNKLPLLSILSYLNFPHHLFPPLSQFGTNARSLWLRGRRFTVFLWCFLASEPRVGP